jgi:hypothetical protein
MIDNLLRDLQILHKADFLVGRIWLNVLVRRLGFLAFAALIAVFGLGMTNVAGFYALEASVGAVWGAAIVAVADLVIAAVILLVGNNARPGPEIDLAFEVRKMAVESIQADTRDLKRMVEAVSQDIQNARATIAGVVQNPLDVAAQKLLVPAALSILRGLRSKKEHA